MQRIWAIGIFSLGLISAAPIAQAADVDKTTPEPKAPAIAVAPAKPVAAPEAPMAAAPAPIKTAIVEGTIKSVTLHPQTPALVLTPKTGQDQVVTWMPEGVTVWQNDRPASPKQLSAGQWVKIETEFHNGQWMAKKILIQAAPAAARASAPGSSAAY